MSNTIKFTKTRDVKSPNRGTLESAGIDFYIPTATSDFIYDFASKNVNAHYKLSCWAHYEDVKQVNTIEIFSGENFDEVSIYDVIIGGIISNFNWLTEDEIKNVVIDKFEILIAPHNRILVPSGIKVWIEDKSSALIATNKSGIATKKGLVVGATTIDSDYTGEMHLSVINTTDDYISVVCGEKLIQFIHTPVILSTMEEVDNETYDSISTDTDRGAGGFGSTGLN